jgi:hypothetical protein
MSTLVSDFSGQRATDVRITADMLTVYLSDGRSVSAPLEWYPRLLYGRRKERLNFRLIAGGEGIHWPDLDEDISVENLLAGKRSRESAKSIQRWRTAREV